MNLLTSLKWAVQYTWFALKEHRLSILGAAIGVLCLLLGAIEDSGFSMVWLWAAGGLNLAAAGYLAGRKDEGYWSRYAFALSCRTLHDLGQVHMQLLADQYAETVQACRERDVARMTLAALQGGVIAARRDKPS